ncbi:MAG: hypothetical protein ABIH71_06420 [Candidatus Omnitrophota bacterium]|nr:hypothetical protein [Candidatus Omnitrophota bacterium]
MGKELIIHAGFGEGHKMASLALRDFLDAPCHDLLDFCHQRVSEVYARGYHSITNKYFFVWNVLFYAARLKVVRRLITRFHKLIFPSFLRYLRENNFRTLIITHFFPLQLAAQVKDELGFKIITIITDFKVHPLWISDKVDLYFAAMEETKQNLIALGVDQEKIIAGTVPLREGFLDDLSQNELRKKFSLDQKPCLLFMSSIRGNFPFFKEVFPDLIGKFNVIVIYGRNQELKKYLSKFKSNSLRIFLSYEQMWELTSLSSIIISKPGGLTSFEGVYKKKFFIFTHYIPGQEKQNMDLLIKYGIAKYASNKDDFFRALDYFQHNADKLKSNYPLELKDIRPALSRVI